MWINVTNRTLMDEHTHTLDYDCLYINIRYTVRGLGNGYSDQVNERWTTSLIAGALARRAKPIRTAKVGSTAHSK